MVSDMLICVIDDMYSCPALGSQCDCFPWCDHLREDGEEDGEIY